MCVFVFGVREIRAAEEGAEEMGAYRHDNLIICEKNFSRFIVDALHSNGS